MSLIFIGPSDTLSPLLEILDAPELPESLLSRNKSEQSFETDLLKVKTLLQLLRFKFLSINLKD